jgi:hypothetical protein
LDAETAISHSVDEHVDHVGSSSALIVIEVSSVLNIISEVDNPQYVVRKVYGRNMWQLLNRRGEPHGVFMSREKAEAEAVRLNSPEPSMYHPSVTQAYVGKEIPQGMIMTKRGLRRKAVRGDR